MIISLQEKPKGKFVRFGRWKQQNDRMWDKKGLKGESYIYNGLFSSPWRPLQHRLREKKLAEHANKKKHEDDSALSFSFSSQAP